MFTWIGENIESYFQELWRCTIAIIATTTILVSNIPNGAKHYWFYLLSFMCHEVTKDAIFEGNERDVVAQLLWSASHLKTSLLHISIFLKVWERDHKQIPCRREHHWYNYSNSSTSRAIGPLRNMFRYDKQVFRWEGRS